MTRTRFIAGMILLVACGLWLAWVTGGVSAVFHHRLASALAARDYESAERLLRWVKDFRAETPSTAYWEARLKRKQLLTAEVPRLLVAAGRGGVEENLLRRETLLLKAQVGDIRPIRKELDRLLTDPGEDGAEICEAYVNGCLIAGEYDLGLAIMEVWQKDFPSDPQPHYARGRFFEHFSRVDEAQAEYRSALLKNPNHWGARYSLARSLLSQNQAAAALDEFTHCTRMQRNAAPELGRAKSLRELGRPVEARQILENLVRRPVQEIRASFDRVGEPVHGLPNELELGTLLLELKDSRGALHWLERALEDDPKDPEVRYHRALALRQLGRQDEAASEFEHIQRDRAKLEELDKLVDDVQHHPDEARLEDRTRIGEAYLRHGSRVKAEFWLRSALNRDPSYSPANELLAEYYSELARKNPEYSALVERHRRAASAAAP